MRNPIVACASALIEGQGREELQMEGGGPLAGPDACDERLAPPSNPSVFCLPLWHVSLAETRPGERGPATEQFCPVGRLLPAKKGAKGLRRMGFSRVGEQN